ncbi:MAG: M23 family metallopeptidase [Fibrobacter sp.]|uniref:M23 family metallopeptidase n=1 Tax=Fibrobacter sp. TaxID=35828 RepID=UPI001B0EACB6|nr:M23 family metallopeptidase [Fibrobacter sp.]MBO5533264.1 M23 family metallopeptidase [Fibrobacter sp.]MDY6264787.1 M23 family metallopeptidase [Fibrobacter sp.]
MKKLEVHVFPSKTASGKSYIFSFWGAIIAVVAVVAAVLGFVLFSPVQILDNVTSGNVTNVYRQNAAIKKELKEIRASVDSSILRAEETRVLRDSTLKVGGLGFMLDGSALDDSLLQKRKSVNEVEASFKKLLAALEKDSVTAEKIPVLHPMKNGHAVKKRFEIVYDPFTDSELPHRGIDYVAAEGDTVYATGAGTVIEVRKHRGFGLSVKVDHGHDVRTFYAHLGKNLVNQGQTVHRGQPIALIGESGTQSSIGLHYEIRIDGISVNPESFYLTK